MRTLHILLVEDNEGDILLTQEAFEDRKVISKMSVVKNGQAAIDFVFKRGEYQDVEKPDLILLDINLPVKNGLEVLKEIKSDEKTRKIPVIVLTTSVSTRDIDQAYYSYANSYVSKPLEIDEFIHAIHKIEDFWLQLVKLSDDG